MIKNETEEAIQYLSHALKLNARGDEQDWGVELSDKDRIDEFLEFYKTEKLDPDKKFSLMSLILFSFEELVYMEAENENAKKKWNEIISLIDSDKRCHEYSIHYWCFWDSESETDSSPVAKLMRKYFLENSVGLITPEDYLKMNNEDDFQNVYYW